MQKTPNAARGGDADVRSSSASRRNVRKPQQARSRRTRMRVLEAAVECFDENGYDETTTAMIAARAEVAVGSVYGYFADKRAILLELLDATVREVADFVIEELEPDHWRGRDPREQTRSLIDAVFHSQRFRPGIQRILWERYFKDDDFRAPFEAIRSRIREAIDAFIAACSSDVLRSDLDPELASFVVLNAVQWNATQSFMHGDAEAIDRAASATADMVARYLFVESADPR